MQEEDNRKTIQVFIKHYLMILCHYLRTHDLNNSFHCYIVHLIKKFYAYFNYVFHIVHKSNNGKLIFLSIIHNNDLRFPMTQATKFMIFLSLI